MSESEKLASEVGRLREAYESLIRDELARYRYALNTMNKIWPLLPDLEPTPDTVVTIFPGKTFDENFISDYLAYVIDPERNGIGIEPLRTLLHLVHADIDKVNFEDIKITREYDLASFGRIDLVVEIDNQFIIGIENKIYASEGKGQTPGYVAGLKSVFPDHDRFHIYLTRRGGRPGATLFVPISYGQLSEAFAKIQYNWSVDIKRSILWEDFLQHVSYYLSEGVNMIELSEKTKLYLANLKMIRDLTKSYERDASAIFQLIENRVKDALPADGWETNFQPTRGWQQYYRVRWNRPLLNVHYEYFVSRDLLMKEKFGLVVDVERSQKAKFIKLFEKRLASIQPIYDRLGITYRPKNRSVAIAYKWFPLDKKIETITDQFIEAMEEFAFLTPVLDEVMVEYLAEIE